MEMVLKLTLAILGIALYTIFKARDFIFSKDKPFYWDVFVSENIKSWVWSILVRTRDFKPKVRHTNCNKLNK